MFSAENREKGSLYKGLVRALARRIFVKKGQRRLRVRLRNGDTIEFFRFGDDSCEPGTEVCPCTAIHSFPKFSMKEVLGQYCSLPAVHRLSRKEGTSFAFEVYFTGNRGLGVLTSRSSHSQPLQAGQGNSISISVLHDRYF